MTNHQGSPDRYDLEPALARAVQAVRAETVPDDVVARAIDRARRLDTAVSGSSPAANEPQPRVRPRPTRWILAWSVSGAGAMAASLLLALFLFSGNASVSWAEMLKALASRPWIHATTTYPGSEQTVTSESWVSSPHRCAAIKFGDRRRFIDLENGISLEYNAQDGTIDRTVWLAHGDAGPADAQLPGLLDRLIADKADAGQLFRGERVIKAERHEEQENGKQWLDYLIYLQRIDNSTLDRTVRIRLDRATQLPESWVEQRANGILAVTRFDYPDSGPRDIYELGVPKTATLIDRVPTGDLARIMAAQRADRGRFGPYDAIVVQQTEGVTTSFESLMNLSARRVRRKGAQYRVDALLCANEGINPPAPGTDMQQWWKENRDRYWSVPQLICDGEVIHFYKMLNDRIVPGKKPNLSVVEFKQSLTELPTDDSQVAWPHLMPEQCCRPHLWPSDNGRKLDVDTEASDGPQGTVRVIVTQKTEPRAGEVYRYWFDPDRDYTLGKQIARVFDSRTNKFAYLDTQQYDEFAQSPSGIWYPRLVRRTTSDAPQWRGVTQFFVDFETEIDGALFRPVSEP